MHLIRKFFRVVRKEGCLHTPRPFHGHREDQPAASVCPWAYIRRSAVPRFLRGKENQAMGLRVMREQVLPRQEAGETEGRDTSPLALDPARVAIFISGQSQSHGEPAGADSGFQKPRSLAEGLEIFVAVGRSGIEKHRRFGQIHLINRTLIGFKPRRGHDDPLRRKARDPLNPSETSSAGLLGRHSGVRTSGTRIS